jgi:transcriptional regulator with XRE-family HTH domain
MNTIVKESGGYSFHKGLARAKTRSAYYEEGLLIDIAARVIDAMEKNGITRSDLARRLKVSPSYITKVLRGHANMSLESLAKIAFVMDLKWECIMVPVDAQFGAFSLTDEFGKSTICTEKTAIVKESRRKTTPNDDSQYAEGTHFTKYADEGECYELPIPA